MTKNNTVEKIDQIINKIEKNIAKKLDQDDAQEVLVNIDEELKEIVKSVEEEQGVIVKELRKKIDKSLSDEDGWGKIKILLKKDVKGELEGLKSELEKSEEVSVSIPTIVENKLEKAELEELTKWRDMFPGQTPEEAAKNQKKFVEGWVELQKELRESTKKTDIIEVGQAVSDVAYRFEKLGYEAGKDALPLFGTAAGAVLGGAGGIIAGGTQYAAHFANKGMDMVDDTRKDAKDFAVKTIEMGAEGFDKTREGMKEYALETQRGLKEHVEHHADNAEKLAEKVLDNTKEVINKGIGIFDVTGAAKSIATNLADKISEAQIKKAEADARAREKELGEKENQIKKLEERIAKKDEKIEKLEEKIEKLEEKLEKSQDRLIVQVEEVAKSRSSSPTPYSRQ